MKFFKKWTLFAVIMIAFLSSCEVKEVNDVYVNSFTQNYTVKKGDWNIGTDDKSGIYYYYEFKESHLTQDVFNYGAMQAFLQMNDGNISPLPFNDYWIEETDGFLWTEQVTCEFRPGYVTFIVKSSDHMEIRPHYDAYDFRVRFVW